MTLFTGNIAKLQHLGLRSFRPLLGILFLMVPFFIPRSGLASELGNVLAEAHFTAYGWQSTAMRIEGSYTDRTWKELHLAQLRNQQQVIIRFQDVSPATLIVRHSGTYHQGQSQTFINVTVNGRLVEQGYLVPGHLDPGTGPAAGAMPPLKSWRVSKWMRPGENKITISLHSSAATVYWLTDIWLSGSQDFGKGLKEKKRAKDDVAGVGSDKKFQYEKACDNGDAGACVDLGYMYGTGKGVEQDSTRAMELYEKGCEGGNAVGCANLGWMYYRGRGLAPDRSRARALLEKACALGNQWGCDRLGEIP